MAEVTRPILVLSGWRAWPPLSKGVAKKLARRLGELRSQNPSPVGSEADILSPKGRGTGAAPRFEFLPIWFHDLGTFDACVQRVVTQAHERFGADAECEIVGVSMGGLVARKAILDGHNGMRIRAHRVFTLASPHRGSKLARWVRPDGASRDMRPGSPFLRGLNEREASAWNETRPYELVCYARLGDTWVGAINSAPEGEHPIWVPAMRFQPSHLTISRDPRILDDIARRMMGLEASLTPNGPPPRD